MHENENFNVFIKAFIIIALRHKADVVPVLIETVVIVSNMEIWERLTWAALSHKNTKPGKLFGWLAVMCMALPRHGYHVYCSWSNCKVHI